MTKEEYLKDPCAVSSIPYWKAMSITLPGNIKIVHKNQFDEGKLDNYKDTIYI